MIRCDYCSQPATNRIFDDSKTFHIHYVCAECKPKYVNDKTQTTEITQAKPSKKNIGKTIKIDFQ